MNKRVHMNVRLPLAVFALISLAPGQPAEQSGSSCSISGVVQNRQRKPWADAHVGADNPAADRHYEATTDSHGFYMLKGLRPGRYTVWARVPAVGCTTIPNVVVTKNESRNLDLRVDAAEEERCDALEKNAGRRN